MAADLSRLLDTTRLHYIPLWLAAPCCSSKAADSYYTIGPGSTAIQASWSQLSRVPLTAEVTGRDI